ncbi:MAG TPA: hypothetical protein VHC19_27010, partial [Pirellulales bacterium]|nr:hypothetical protein [Pirellulales bacterium]
MAAKSWAALFAVGDWAFALRDGKKTAKPKPTEPSLFDLLKKIARNAEKKRQIETWSPRSLVVDVDYPSTGTPADYTRNTPEHAVALICDHWRHRNYGRMAGMFKYFDAVSITKA